MHTIVKFTKDDDGYSVKNDKWHLVVNEAGCHSKSCTGEVFGFGSSGVEFKEKDSIKGGVTCPACIEKIKFYKAIQL